MTQKLIFLAGERALQRIRDGGLDPADVKVMAGAAGGAKWLILGQMDRFFFGEWFKGREDPLFLLGSSIGSWRFAAASCEDPVAAFDRFECAYIHQTYDRKPSAAEVSQKSRSILDACLGHNGNAEVLSHPFQRLSFLAVRSRHLLAADRTIPLAVGMVGVLFANSVSRKSLRYFFHQTLFSDRRSPPPFLAAHVLPVSRADLTEENLKMALLASGSIPQLMEGVRGIPGAPAGVYRDGGAVDYHLDIPFGLDGSGIVLYPHYTDRVVPGWLDKKLPWRKPSPGNLADVLIVAPSAGFLARLPLGKISDRTDFYRFAGDDRGRFDYWQKVADAGKELADDFISAVETGRIKERVAPL